MNEDATIELVVDSAQRRVPVPSFHALLSGKTWGRTAFNDVWVEPDGKRLLLVPLPVTTAWSTTGSGNYARLAKANYSLITASKWVDHDRGRVSGDVYLASLDVNEAVITTASWEANRGFFLSWVAYNTGNDNFAQVECGWGDTAGNHAKSSVSLKFYSDNRVEVYRYGALVGEGTISRPPDDFHAAQRAIWDKGGAQTAHSTVDIVLLPFARRELLIYSITQGGAFTHTFDDIGDEDRETTLIPASKFWWKVPSGQATVSAAPLRFATEGYITSKTITFDEPPPVGTTFEFSVFSDDAYPGVAGADFEASVVEAGDPATTFTPDGVKTKCRIRLDFTNGIVTHAPTVYGVAMFSLPQVKETPDEEVDLLPYCTSLKLSVPESPSDVALDVELMEPEAIEGLGASRLRSIANRSVALRLDGLDILDGVAEAPSWVEAISDEARKLTLKVRDSWKRLESQMFSAEFPFDSLQLTEALRRILTFGPFEASTLEMDGVDFELPTGGNTAEGKFAVMAEPGDKLSDWMTRLHDTYIGTWMYGFAPTADGIRFILRDPEQEDIDDDVIELFDDNEEAIQHYRDAGESELEARRKSVYKVFRNFTETTLEPQANAIVVSGYDWRKHQAILVKIDDEKSIDPELPVADRPDNWLGERRPFVWGGDPTLASKRACVRVAELLFDRMTPARKVCEFSAELLRHEDGRIVWPGFSRVNLKRKGVYRITSMAADFVKEPSVDGTTDKWRWRTTTYTALQLRPYDPEETE